MPLFEQRPTKYDSDATEPILRIEKPLPTVYAEADDIATRPDRLLVFGSDEDYWRRGEDDGAAFEEAQARMENAHRSLGRIGIIGPLVLAGAVTVATVFVGTTGTKYIPGLKPDKPPATAESTIPSEAEIFVDPDTSTSMTRPSQPHLTEPPRPEMAPPILTTSPEDLMTLQTPTSPEQTSSIPTSEPEETTSETSAPSELPTSPSESEPPVPSLSEIPPSSGTATE